MKRRKFKKGKLVINVGQILEHDWFIFCFGSEKTKTMHREVLSSWQLRTCEACVEREQIYIAERLTNGEYYSDKTDEELQGMLDERLCDFCPLPDELKGVHCYGGEPVMCEGSHCKEAVEAWKEDLVE